MTRPTDWSALGLDSDPTPGDPTQVQDVYNLLNSLAGDYQMIMDTLNTVNGYATSDNLVGKTADALRDQMNGRITKFVQSAQDAFPQAATAMQTYYNALTAQQQIADNLLTQAQNSGLKSTDPQIKTWASQANSAASTLSSAENTAASAIRNLPGPSNPLSPWQEFLQILGWIAMLLILPAMVFGGVIALVEFVVNAILFINAIVQFAQGNLSFGGLLLAALGVIAPTTRALDIGDIVDLVKGIGSGIKSSIITIKSGFSDFVDLITTAKVGDLLTLDNLIKLGTFVLKAGVWVFNGLKELPSTFVSAGAIFAEKLGDLIVAGGIKVVTSLKSGSYLSLILPIDAAEVEREGLGLVSALKLGFIDRGLGVTTSAGRDLTALNKLSVAGVHIADANLNGAGHINLPTTEKLDINIPELSSARVSGLNTNLDLRSLDVHLEAPHLSIGNLAAGFQHDALDIGNISFHLPSGGFRMTHLEVPDLRNPVELNRIGQGSVVAHSDNFSFVAVHEDMVPKTLDTHLPAGSTVSSVHTSEISVPTLHTVNLGGTTIRPVAGHETTNLSSIAHAKIENAEVHGFTVGQTFDGVKVTAVPHLEMQHLNVGDANLGALQHLATPHLTTPHLTMPHLAEDSHLSESLPPEIRNLQANPEIGAQISATGLRSRPNEQLLTIDEGSINVGHEPIGANVGTTDVTHLAETPAVSTHSVELPTVTERTETPVPAVSSSKIDDISAHSAGSRGGNFADPDLAGKPGLLDPNGERLAVSWTAFKQAQHDYIQAAAEHDLRFPEADPETGIGVSGSKGKDPQTPAQVEAASNLKQAALAFHETTEDLHELGTSPAELTAKAHSAATVTLKEHGGGLLGGARPGDRPIRVDPQTQQTLVSARSIGPDHELYIAHNGDHEYGQIVNVHHAEDGPTYEGVLTEIDGHGGFRLTPHDDDGWFREFQPDGTQYAEGHGLFDQHGDPMGDLMARPNGDFEFHQPGQNAVTGLDFERLPDGGMRIGETGDGWRSWTFDGDRLTHGPMELTDHLGNPAMDIQVNHLDGTAASAHVDGEGGNWTHAPAPDGSGDFRLTPLGGTGDSWHDFNAAGQLIGRGSPFTHEDGHLIGDIELDLRGAPPTHTATITDHEGVDSVTAHVDLNGNEALFTLADGSIYQVADHGGQTVLTHAELHVTLRGAPDRDLNHVNVDYTNGGTADFHAPGLPDQTWDFQHSDDHEGFTLTSQGGMHVLHFDENDALAQHVITTRDPATGNPGAQIHVSPDIDRAAFQHPNLPDHTQWIFSHDDEQVGAFALGSLDGVHTLHFDANGELHYTSLTMRDPVSDELTNLRALTDHLTGPGGHQHFVVDENSDVVQGLDMRVDPQGHITITNTRNGPANGEFTTFDGVSGAVRAERVNLKDVSGMHVDVDHLAVGGPTSDLRDATGANVGRFNITRDANDGHFEISDAAASHLGDTKAFDAHGEITAAHISVLTAKGERTGDHFDVTFGAKPKWTRTNTTAGDGRLGTTYNASGAAKLKKDGTLVLEGADKTPLYTREHLATGQDLELLKMPNGQRRWTTWDADGNLTGSGFRRFSNEDGGVDAKDVNSVGLTIRQYRVGVDGGTVRGEKMPDGTWTWTRFSKDGTEGLSGTRNRPLLGAFGWKDTFGTGAAARPAQEHWSAFNFTTHAGHYREHPMSADPAAPGGFTLKGSYKEISQQGKDTGSVELLDGNHTLQFTRYTEQRIPDFMWKDPKNMSPGVSKGLAYITPKYGSVDFPRQGFAFGDSRFQVFKWVEKDATGAKYSGGVRVFTPDGSFSDFAGDGLFVRGAIKLDNGHTVEIGRTADGGKWDSFHLDPVNPNARPTIDLHWRELDGSKNVVNQGTRTFDGKTWIDSFADGDNVLRVIRHTTDDGDVVHFTGSIKPEYHPTLAGDLRIGHTMVDGTHVSIVRNTMGQIVERTDRWGRFGMPRNVTGHGDPRTGQWQWRDQYDAHGIRISARNTPHSGSWDDSYTDFRVNDQGMMTQIRDFRALDKGTSLRMERSGNNWMSMKYDFKGDPIDGTQGFRSWQHSDGHFYNRPEPARDPKIQPWRDTDADGNVIRQTFDDKVREFTDPANAHGGDQVWKEYNFGSVWRQRQPVDGHPNLFMEKESFQKQWRVTDQNGVLLQFRSISGRVMELGTFGKWTLVGTEREAKGLVPQLNEFRGWNRGFREPNRMQYVKQDGLVGEFKSTWSKLAEKSAADFLQDFLIDVAANVIITGATDGWNFNSGQIGGFFAGAAIRSGFKGAYGVLSETALKGFRDGLRNLDGGKDFNRQPYNNDKHWDNEWAGNENPPRWRAGTFDFFVGNTFVPAIGSFLATLATGSSFGFGEKNFELHGGELAEAAGLSMAGSLVGGLTFGAIKTLGHLSFSGRWFHQGGIPDITLTFAEKLAIDYLVNDLMANATGLSGSHEAKHVQAQLDLNSGTGDNGAQGQVAG